MYLDLDKVNIAFASLAPEIIACSETQERFCLAVPRHFSEEVLDIFNNQFDIPTLYPNGGAAVIGHVTTDNRFIMTYRGDTICDLDVESITTEVKANRKSEVRVINKKEPASSVIQLKATLKEVTSSFISQLNNRSKRYVYRFFDNAVQGNTFIYPGEADAVVVTPIEGSLTGLAVSMDSNLYGEYDPYISGAGAVAESIRNVVAVGARPIALTDCLNYGNHEKPPVFFDFQEGVRGIKEAAEALSMTEGDPVPIISGNVSFYNESKQGSAVVPSPVICCMGKVDNINMSKPMQCIETDQQVYVIGKRYSEFAGTQIQSKLVQKVTVAPQVRLDAESKQNKAVLTAIQNKFVDVVHDIAMGGVFQSVVEMSLGERGYINVGMQLELSQYDEIEMLFSENGGYVVTTSNVKALEDHLETHQVWFAKNRKNN